MVEVGGWEHECCGPSFERGSFVELTCLDLSGSDPSSTRYVESHHELSSRRRTVTHRGRVADVAVQHADGSVEPIHRLPSGRALRGFDEDDDGHLEEPWNGRAVARDSDQFLVTVLT
ncbi:hypothetical protein SAMN04488544_1145 [Microlunatus sagamiharensis]|uniref:Uncharacterized protein n=1 Tax=Microlunatus sagamiharensis TaxID=546874 RepID=A0A1H2M078_9ACTN|nr:hypothetical protein SAMN04488544_1145 [Microlunatus sagamiharensis]